MIEAPAWGALPPEVHDSVWEETERNFWAEAEETQQRLAAKAEQEYQDESTKIRVDMGTLTGKHNELTKSQERVARELAAIEQELAHVRDARDAKADWLTQLETRYRKHQQGMLERREQVRVTMTNFFRDKRGLEPLPVPEHIMRGEGDVNGTGQPGDGGAMEGVVMTNGNGATPARTPAPGLETLVDVVDADDNVVGPVERIEPWNQWIEGIQDLPIRRKVKIRRGRRFGADHLASIYDRSEAKGVKWLSCMIQAVGEVQTRRCHSCEKNQGAFENCIIVGSELYPKCGNCEWNRQGCHGASREGIDVAAAQQQALEQRGRREAEAAAAERGERKKREQDTEVAEREEREGSEREAEAAVREMNLTQAREAEAAEHEKKMRLSQEAEAAEQEQKMKRTQEAEAADHEERQRRAKEAEAAEAEAQRRRAQEAEAAERDERRNRAQGPEAAEHENRIRRAREAYQAADLEWLAEERRRVEEERRRVGEASRQLEEERRAMEAESRRRALQAPEGESAKQVDHSRHLDEMRQQEAQRQQEARMREAAAEKARLAEEHLRAAGDYGRAAEERPPRVLEPSREQRDRGAARYAMERAAGLAQEALHSHPAPAAAETPTRNTAHHGPPNGRPVDVDQRQTPTPPGPREQHAAPGFRPTNAGFTPANSGPAPVNPGFAPANMGTAPANSGFTPANPGFTPANSGGFTPANARSRPPSHGTSTPTVASAEPSPQPSEAVPDEPLEEITRENLVLRHDGSIYTQPSCMHGVPLDKIHPGHWYWEDSWPNVRELIEPQWQSWQAKYHEAIRARDEGRKGGSSKYQIGRQVNRGTKIFEFLEQGTISPYQLLGKRFVQTGKGGITSYDTLFRLSETLSELEKFKLDVTPVEWVRHRLWEVMEAAGYQFNLHRTIHDFYHDPKLSALRHKHGYKNIGRPSGMGAKSRQSLDGASDSPSGKSKRTAYPGLDSGGDSPSKRQKSHEGTPRGTPHLEHSPLNHVFIAPETPASAHLLQRRAQADAGDDALSDAGNYSEADSATGMPLERNDFRLAQVKTMSFTSDPRERQYWSWLPDPRVLQHQVLRPSNPPRRDVLARPVSFHVSPADVELVAFNRDLLRLHLVMHRNRGIMCEKYNVPRGDVMAEFKREGTLMRFLRLCERLKIRTLSATREQIAERYDKVRSEQVSLDGVAGPPAATAEPRRDHGPAP